MIRANGVTILGLALAVLTQGGLTLASPGASDSEPAAPKAPSKDTNRVSAAVANFWATGVQVDAATPWRLALHSYRLGKAGDGPKKLVESPYYPSKVGTTWTYELNDKELVSKITAHEEMHDILCIKVESTVAGKTVATEHISIAAEGVSRVAFGSNHPDKPLLFLKLPVKIGERWKVDVKVGLETVVGEFTTSEEKVKVPSGTYDAIKVDGEFQLNGVDTQFTYWFAKDVGVVKQYIKMPTAEITSELKKFDPGK